MKHHIETQWKVQCRSGREKYDFLVIAAMSMESRSTTIMLTLFCNLFIEIPSFIVTENDAKVMLSLRLSEKQ